jgi:sigma-B regulation protein RsbU (phosphoserine phosphatase)
LFFCIGDVSGHGIAAAMFMARTIGLVRTLAQTTVQPAVLLTQLNDRLCIGNETNIFVTLFCGVLNSKSGQLVYSNAGHCAPMLLSNEKANSLPLPKGALLGAWPNLSYAAQHCTLAPGETLFCFTDGVTEASNPQNIEFSEERCMTLLTSIGYLGLSELIDRVREEVQIFSETSYLADDCTMLALRRPSL